MDSTPHNLMKTLLHYSLAAGLFLFTAPHAQAQDTFSLAWATIDGGGGRSTTPAEFTLAGSSVGQFEAGNTGGGLPGEFSVASGFWTFSWEPPPLPELTMTLAAGTVTLTWAAPAPPVTLESSADLELWTPVDPQPATPFFQEPEGARMFYRLVPGP
jgi:hypothetical protein